MKLKITESGNNMKVAVSILSIDFSKIDLETKKLNDTDCEYIHLDVMDGKFVPNKTFDYNFIKTLKFDKIIDTHLMIEKPLDVIDEYLKVSDIVTIHYEALSKEELRNFLSIKRTKKIGLSIKPNTLVSEIKEFLPLIDLVLVMSVEPGFGGQSFQIESIKKIEELALIKKQQNLNYIIEVDGGINEQTSKMVKDAGCEVVVVGTFVVKNNDYQIQINKVR